MTCTSWHGRMHLMTASDDMVTYVPFYCRNSVQCCIGQCLLCCPCFSLPIASFCDKVHPTLSLVEKVRLHLLKMKTQEGAHRLVCIEPFLGNRHLSTPCLVVSVLHHHDGCLKQCVEQNFYFKDVEPNVLASVQVLWTGLLSQFKFKPDCLPFSWHLCYSCWCSCPPNICKNHG